MLPGAEFNKDASDLQVRPPNTHKLFQLFDNS
jgi:hypothetical protein